MGAGTLSTWFSFSGLSSLLASFPWFLALILNCGPQITQHMFIDWSGVISKDEVNRNRKMYGTSGLWMMHFNSRNILHLGPWELSLPFWILRASVREGLFGLPPAESERNSQQMQPSGKNRIEAATFDVARFGNPSETGLVGANYLSCSWNVNLVKFFLDLGPE